MRTLEQIKTVLKYASKQKREALNHCLITPKGIQATDLETNVLIKNSYDLKGVYKIDQLGAFSKASELIKVEDIPWIEWELKEVDKIHVSIKTLETINKHSSKDETRIFLNGIYFDNENIVATNGYHLKAVRHEQTLNNSYIIPRESIDILSKLCKAYKVSSVVLRFEPNWVEFNSEHFTWQSRLINREYIKYQAVIPKKWNETMEIKNFPELKTYKTFLEKNKEKSILEIINNEIFFIIPNTEIKIKIGETSIKDTAIGFNPLFLEIAREDKKDFTINFNSELSPVLINDSIIMPLKL